MSASRKGFGVALTLAMLTINATLLQAQRCANGMTNWPSCEPPFAHTDPTLMGAVMAYEKVAIRPGNGSPDVTGGAVQLRVDSRIVSWFTNRHGLGLTSFDALHMALTWGRVTSDPQMLGAISDDDRLAILFSFGYELLPGYRFRQGAIFAGLRLDRFYTSLGGTSMNGTLTPLVVRLELGGARKALVVTGVRSLGGSSKVTGGQVFLPITGRWSLTGRYDQIEGNAILFSALSSTPAPATRRTLVVGLRVGSVR